VTFSDVGGVPTIVLTDNAKLPRRAQRVEDKTSHSLLRVASGSGE
jgi:hypothetical protein